MTQRATRKELVAPGKVVTAVARELVGFIWAIATAAESQHLQKGEEGRVKP